MSEKQEEILEAFLSAEQRRVVFDPKRMTKNWNYWTLSLTAARAFTSGEIRLENQGITKVRLISPLNKLLSHHKSMRSFTTKSGVFRHTTRSTVWRAGTAT